MKTVYKICLVHLGVATLLALLLTYGADGPVGRNDFIGFFGLVCIILAPVDVVVGLLLFVFRKSVWGQGFLLSAGVLLLLGFALCSTMQFH